MEAFVQMKHLRIGLLVLLPIVGAFPISDPTPPPSPPPAELVVTGRLARIAHGAGCGYFSMGVVAEYSDLQILEGTYKEQRLFVVHGCPELSRPEFSASAGSLASLEIGAYHRLELLTKNFYRLELVYGEELKPAQLPLFYVSRADPQSRCQALRGARASASRKGISSLPELPIDMAHGVRSPCPALG
jgi:hypothetical protein